MKERVKRHLRVLVLFPAVTSWDEVEKGPVWSRASDSLRLRASQEL